MRLCERLTSLRVTSGRTRAQMAEDLGVCLPMVYRWEKGEVTPHLLSLLKYTAVTGKTVVEILSGCEEYT